VGRVRHISFMKEGLRLNGCVYTADSGPLLIFSVNCRKTL